MQLLHCYSRQRKSTLKIVKLSDLQEKKVRKAQKNKEKKKQIEFGRELKWKRIIPRKKEKKSNKRKENN